MITLNALIKKLFVISLYSSFLIAGVSVIPLFQALKSVSFSFYLILILIITANIFLIWSINILLVYYFERKPLKKNSALLRYFLSFVLNITISGLFIMVIESFKITDIYLPEENFFRLGEQSRLAPFFSSMFTNAFVLFMQELVLLRERKARIELENAQLKIENSKALNQQLKQHIHPHFLFNSLSILKSLIHNNPDVAEEYVIRLSGFLRTSISSNESHLVKLADELKLCEDYIEMQKIRFGSALVVLFNLPENKVLNGFVPGFSIQLLLENAIKHNALTPVSPLQINVNENNGCVTVENNIQKKNSIEESTQLGLANLTERYRIISGSDIKVESDDKTFKVSIKILNHANSNN